MEYAVIATGGKQYLAYPGKPLVLESLPGEAGDPIVFDQVLLSVNNEDVRVGMPVVGDVTVSATIVRQDLGDKIKVFKYKPKARYRRTTGHRQHQTVVMIDTIGAPAKAAKPAKKTTEIASVVQEGVIAGDKE